MTIAFTAPHPPLPRIALPPGACDAHCHIFGPQARFPLAPNRAYTPPDVPEPVLRALHDNLGFSRCVLVQPAAHGFDHSALLDALARAPERYRGVALLDPQASPGSLARLNDAGVRGVRINFLPHLGPAPEVSNIRLAAARAAELGWHLAVHLDAPALLARQMLLERLQVPVVIDHMARVNPAEGTGGAAFIALRRLLQGGRIWVKLSGTDRLSRQPYPHDDAVELAALLVREAPDRVVWGTDFPHVNIAGPPPDDAALVALIDRIAPETALRRQLLVNNPAALYGFVAPVVAADA